MTYGIARHGTSRKWLAVLVLYRRSLAESTTFQSLVRSCQSANLESIPLSVYDNSPLPAVSTEEASRLLAYRHDPSNGGLAVAYNWALIEAEEGDIDWLLLLDQDSCLPRDYIAKVDAATRHYGECGDVIALVPHVATPKGIISPIRNRRFTTATIPVSFFGICAERIAAINSGTLVRTAFLRQIGGFNLSYPIDYLDHWLFYRIHTSGKQIAVIDSCIDHELSVHNYRTGVSFERYRGILAAEERFVHETDSALGRALYPIQLAFRAVKQLFIYRRPRLAIHTLRTALHFDVCGETPGRDHYVR